MGLTLAWWTDLKNKTENKSNGKVAPETEFEKKLKLFDQARIDVSTCTSLIPLNKMAKALADVELARKPSVTALEKDFPKLAVFCSVNSRVLSTKIAEEKTPLEAKAKELQAKLELGAPQMKGLGPGVNMRQTTFTKLQTNFKKLHDELKKTQTLDPAVVANYAPWMKTFEKDVLLYCKDRPGAKQFSKDYFATVEDLNRVVEKFGTQKMVDALKSIGKQLTSLEAATYIA